MLENLTTLASAWLIFLLMSARELKTLVKRDDQRSETEKIAVKNGLLRLLSFEFFILVPASAALLLLIMPLFTRNVEAFAVLAGGSDRDKIALHAMMGIVSYGFPF